MRSIQLQRRQVPALSAADFSDDLRRYGIDTEPVPEDMAPCTTDTGEVIQLPTEVVISDYPVSDNWCEIVPVRRRPAKPTKETNNGAG